MTKKEMLAVFDVNLANGKFNVESLESKDEMEKEIKMLSENDKVFENLVFEYGVSSLAKAISKRSIRISKEAMDIMGVPE